jgi:hypothetical protein
VTHLFQADVKIAVANVLDIISTIDPSKILVKIKLHLLVHLEEDIRRHGNPLNGSTETQESFNVIFRLCSIYSNRLSPSRDIALKMSKFEAMKQRLLGGYWKATDDMNEPHWVCASARVRDFLAQHPVLQRHLGWVEGRIFNAGMFEP